MTCIATGCKNELWLPSRKLTNENASALGWRFQEDGKMPPLSTGASLCPTCVAAGQEANWVPAKARRAT